MPDPVQQSIRFADLTSRFVFSSTVVASPAAAAETIIASITLPSGIVVQSGVLLNGWAAYTVGTAGVSVQLRIRQTSVSGTVVADTGAMTGSQHGAAILSADDINGVDASPGDGQIYKLTMQVASATAASTVSKVLLAATVV